ncbi:MAG: protein-glutamate O-methyltransferase CheR [Armatimonadota bacterium]|nr:protein-glutamate O-methyltransferase CheR [Armatimonadota bacterium]
MKVTEDYLWFCQQVLRKTGLDLQQYKRAQMERRLRSMAERAGARNLEEYWAVLERDSQQFAYFIDRITINVSELFRNPEKFEELRRIILPEIRHLGSPLKVWSAGCSYGAEPYSLAILLEEMRPLNYQILATDVDETILSKAREGVFAPEDMRNVSPEWKQKYFLQRDNRYQVKPELKRNITFRKHNLLADPFENGFHLIVCRNVVIYFTEEAKDRLYARFFQSLVPGGVLFVGSTERIFNYREIGFEMPLSFFYRKPALGLRRAA